MSAPARAPAIAAGGVTLSGIAKSFGAVEILRDIDLRIESGEFVVFVGPSGCGKSTLLRMIAGLEEASDGTISIGGREVTGLDPSARGIAMVFQSYALYPHLTVAENMGFSLKMARRPKAEIDSRVKAVGEILHLGPLLDRRPGQLSGGQRQRVAIGRAIVRDPAVFLFDEPLSNLDAELRVEMRIEIAKLHRRLGNTMIYVTHDQTEAMTLADRIVVLNGGRIEQVGTPRAIYRDPDNLFVAGFMGSPKMNVFAGRLDGASLAFADLTMPVPAGVGGGHGPQPVSVGLRPEHLRPGAGPGPSLAFSADFTEYLGDTTYLYGQTADGATVVADGGKDGGRDGCAPIDRLHFDADDLLVFGDNGRRLRAGA